MSFTAKVSPAVMLARVSVVRELAVALKLLFFTENPIGSDFLPHSDSGCPGMRENTDKKQLVQVVSQRLQQLLKLKTTRQSRGLFTFSPAKKEVTLNRVVQVDHLRQTSLGKMGRLKPHKKISVCYSLRRYANKAAL